MRMLSMKKKIIIGGMLVIIVGVFAWCNFINPAIVYEDGEIDFVAGYNDGGEYNSSILVCFKSMDLQQW